MSAAEFTAPVAYPRVSSQVLEFASSTRPAEREMFLIESSALDENACWIPASEPSRAQLFIDNVVIDKRLVHAARAASLPAEIIRHVSEARQAYWDLLSAARQDWIAANRTTTPAIARQMSQARETFKLAIRKQFPVGGIAAKAVDVLRGGYAAYQKTLVTEMEAKIAAGRSAEVIESALRTNAKVDTGVRLARTTLPVFKALSIGGLVVAAVELPSHVAAALSAATPEQYDRAFSAAVNTGTSAGLMAVCMVFSIGTGGLAMLACGIAPVAAGFFAGDAALLVRDLIK